METLNIPKQDAALITVVLEKFLGPCTAYVFGRRSFATSPDSVVSPITFASQNTDHYYIVVFTHKTTDGLYGTMADTITQSSNGLIEATLLLHRLKALATPMPDMHRFFDQALRFGHRLCLDRQNVPYLPGGGVPPRDIKTARTYWRKCDEVTSYYLESATESERLDVELIRVALLAQAMEYAALGLIRVFMGYTPNQYSLRFLFGLCRLFTDLPDLFDGIRQSDERLWRQFFAPPTMLRHWDRLEMHEDDYQSVRLACTKWRDKARELALSELERLQNETKIPTI